MCNYDLCKCKHFNALLSESFWRFHLLKYICIGSADCYIFLNVLSSPNKYSIHLKGLSLFIYEKVLQLGQCTDRKVGADQHITNFYEFISGL